MKIRKFWIDLKNKMIFILFYFSVSDLWRIKGGGLGLSRSRVPAAAISRLPAPAIRRVVGGQQLQGQCMQRRIDREWLPHWSAAGSSSPLPSPPSPLRDGALKSPPATSPPSSWDQRKRNISPFLDPSPLLPNPFLATVPTGGRRCRPRRSRLRSFTSTIPWKRRRLYFGRGFPVEWVCTFVALPPTTSAISATLGSMLPLMFFTGKVSIFMLFMMI